MEQQREIQTRMLKEQKLAAEQQERRQRKEAERRAAISMIEGLEGELSILRRSLAAAQAESEAHTTRIKDYAMDHKMAIAALGITVGGAAVAVDDSNDFSDDQKAVATISAVVAGLYALSNAEECAEVADRMAKAATMDADYTARISRAENEISRLQSKIDKAKREIQ